MLLLLSNQGAAAAAERTDLQPSRSASGSQAQQGQRKPGKQQEGQQGKQQQQEGQQGKQEGQQGKQEGQQGKQEGQQGKQEGQQGKQEGQQGKQEGQHQPGMEGQQAQQQDQQGQQAQQQDQQGQHQPDTEDRGAPTSADAAHSVEVRWTHSFSRCSIGVKPHCKPALRLRTDTLMPLR